MIAYKDFREHMLHDSPTDFSEYLKKNIQVQSYIPLGKKTAYIDIFARNFTLVLENLLNDGMSTMADVLMEYELRKVCDIMFRYTNIDFDILYQNNMEYDLIMQSGLYTYVISIAGKDYNILCDYLDTAVGIRDLSIISQMNATIKFPDFEKVNETIDKLKYLDDDKLDKLYHIIDMNDPLTKEVANVVKFTAIREASQSTEDDEQK